MTRHYVRTHTTDTAIFSERKEKDNRHQSIKQFIHLYVRVDKLERQKAGVSIIIQKNIEKYIKTWKPIIGCIVKLMYA